jgi:hypothetical protein
MTDMTPIYVDTFKHFYFLKLLLVATCYSHVDVCVCFCAS